MYHLWSEEIFCDNVYHCDKSFSRENVPEESIVNFLVR